MNIRVPEMRRAALSLVFGVAFLPATSMAVAAVQTDDSLRNAAELVVMLKAPSAGDEKFGLGSGIVFGQDEEHLYIATAHLPQQQAQNGDASYMAYLRAIPQVAMDPEWLTHIDEEPRMTILRIDKKRYRRQLSDVCLRFDRLEKPTNVRRGTRVYAVGAVPSVPWVVPVLPDAVVQVTENAIIFQTAFVGPGHSGGALVDEQGHILGVIQRRRGPLGFAVKVDAVVDRLEARGYPVRLRLTKYGHERPVLAAMQAADEEEANRLINECHDVNVADEDGNTPLLIAARKGSREFVYRLLERSADPNVADAKRNTPLLLATRRGSNEIVARLLAHSANPNVANKRGDTPLALAAHEQNLDMFELLLKNGADPALLGGFTVYRQVVKNQRADMLRALLDAYPKGLDRDDIRRLASAFKKAITKGWKEGISIFLEAGMPINIGVQGWGSGALHLAAAHGDRNTAAFLLEKGADVNGRDKNQSTPLQVASSDRGRVAVVGLLIANGADINAQDEWGQTPLHWAFRGGNGAGAAKLFEVCANPYIYDAYNSVPMEWAPERALRDMFTFLKQSGSLAKNQACPNEMRLSTTREYRGYLGIAMQQLTADLAESLEIEPGRGIFVAQVNEGTPAAEAGLRKGDVIIRFQGDLVEDIDSLKKQVSRTPPGTRVNLTMIRNSKQSTLTVKIGERDPL